MSFIFYHPMATVTITLTESTVTITVDYPMRLLIG